jgi:hypothetical protein
MEGAFKNKDICKEFREELSLLQQKLKNYTKMLADMAGVEDLTEIND